MADEFRNAGIGVNVDIQGMQQLIKLNDMVNQTINSFKQLVTGTQEADTAIGRFGQSGSRHLNTISDAFKTTIASNRLLNDDVKQTQSSFNDFKTDKIEAINSSIKDTMVSNRIFNDDIKATNSAIGDLKTTGFDNVNKAIKDANTSVLHMQKSVSDAKTQVSNIPTGGFDHLKDSINNTNSPIDNLDASTQQNTKHWWSFSKSTQDATQQLSVFKGTAIGTFAGNEIQNGLSSLSSGLKSAVTQGLQFNAATADIKKQWSQIGLSDNQTNGMVAQIAAIRQHADISAASITNMQRQYLTLTGGNVGQAQALTNAVTAFGTESGMNNGTMAGSGQGSNSNNINRLISGGSTTKINARMFQRTFGQSPQFAQEIIKQSGLSKAAFYDLLNSGKMTSAELRADLIKASSDANSAWSNYANTTAGRMSALKMTVANSKKAFDVNLTAGLFDALKQQAGNSGELNKMQKAVQQIATDTGHVLGNTIGSVVGFITKNVGPLKEAGVAVWNIVKALASGAWQVISDLLSTIAGHGKAAGSGLKGFADVLRDIAKHQTTLKIIAGTAVTAVAAFKAFKIVGTVITMFKSLSAAGVALDAVLDANPIGIWVAAISALTIGAIELYKHFKPFRDGVNGVGQAFKDAFGLGLKWGHELFDYFKPALKVMVSDFKAEMNALVKIFRDLWKVVVDIFKGIINFFKDYFRIFSDIFTGNFKDLKKAVPKLFGDMWGFIKNIASDAWKFMNDMTLGMLDKMVDLFKDGFDEVQKVWTDSWNAIGHFFEGIWDWIKQIVSDGINGVLSVINVGIKAIDGAISMFGGNSQAIKPLEMVHLATGTGALGDAASQRRAITKPTMAVLNDGSDSPETGNKEMVIHANGLSELIHGQNTKRLLEPGAEVLNATETKMIMQMSQLQHFAKGTGLFSSVVNGAKHVGSSIWNGAKGVIDSIAGKLKFAQNLVKGPEAWIKSLFGQAKEKGSVLTDLASGMINAPVNAAKNWADELGKMISGSLDGGTGSASGLLAAVEKYGRGHNYVWGATGPDTFDCSGLVQYALKTAFGIDYPRTSGEQIAASDIVSKDEAQPGDLVGNGGHIGVYAGNGKYWSAESPNNHPNIGWSDIAYFPDGAYQFGRVRGLADKTKSQKKDNGGNGLQRLIKSETGGMLGWITKHLAPLLGGSAGGNESNPAGSSVYRWKPDVIKALKANGFQATDSQVGAWMQVINRESGGNPSAVNNWDINAQEGHPSKGLVQTIDSTFDAYKFSGHNDIMNGYDDLLAAINYMKHRYGSDTAAFNRVAAYGYKNGGNVKRDQPILVGEAGPELFTPAADGVVTNHQESKHRVMNNQRSINISAPLTININGNKDDKDFDDKLNNGFNRFLRALAEKIAAENGGDVDNGGGYLI